MPEAGSERVKVSVTGSDQLSPVDICRRGGKAVQYQVYGFLGDKVIDHDMWEGISGAIVFVALHKALTDRAVSQELLVRICVHVKTRIQRWLDGWPVVLVGVYAGSGAYYRVRLCSRPYKQ